MAQVPSTASATMHIARSVVVRSSRRQQQQHAVRQFNNGTLSSATTTAAASSASTSYFRQMSQKLGQSSSRMTTQWSSSPSSLQHQLKQSIRFFSAGDSASAANPPQQQQQQQVYTSYEYPLAKEPPEIVRTTASEATTSTTTATTVEKTLPSPLLATSTSDATAADPFHDAGTISNEERERILEQQKSFIKTTLSEHTTAITAEIPSYIPANVPSSQLVEPETQITTLANGIRVVSQETYGQVSTIGLVANVGSRHERSPAENGITNILEMIAFGTTARSTSLEINHQFENWGGTKFANVNREQILYCIDLLRPNVANAMRLLAECITESQFLPEEIEDVKRTIEFQSLDIPPELLLGEALQTAAFGQDQQLGKPHFVTNPDQIHHLDSAAVRDFYERNILQNPHEIVIAGAGVQHTDFVALADELFGHLEQKTDNDKTSGIIKSTYRGGEARIERKLEAPPPQEGEDATAVDPNGDDMIQMQPPLRPEDEFVRVAVALPTGGWYEQHDLVTACVLQTLLGGGNSFSAGGPGKGMYSRLYRQILNRYNWAESAEAFNAFYHETGLWGISGSTTPDKAHDMTRVFVDHIMRLSIEYVSDEELVRARNMLKCNVLTQLESRLVLFEDLARQVATYGKRENIHTTCERIDAVTAQDIQRLVRKMLNNTTTTYAASTQTDPTTTTFASGQVIIKPTIACVGPDLSNVPQYNELVTWFR